MTERSFGSRILLTALLAGAVAGPAIAREIPSPFLQAMLRAETPNPNLAPQSMAPLSAIRLAGAPLILGRTKIEPLARHLGVRLEHQADAGQSVTWLCVRLDVPAGMRNPPDGQDVLTLWLISDANTVGSARSVNAIALDAVDRDATRCPAPARTVDLVVDRRLVVPGVQAARLGVLYGHTPTRNGRSAYSLPGSEHDAGPLMLTVAMHRDRVQISWLTVTSDN